jgi:hypothetical protein
MKRNKSTVCCRVFDKQTSSACDYLLVCLANQRPLLVGLSAIFANKQCLLLATEVSVLPD